MYLLTNHDTLDMLLFDVLDDLFTYTDVNKLGNYSVQFVKKWSKQ